MRKGDLVRYLGGYASREKYLTVNGVYEILDVRVDEVTQFKICDDDGDYIQPIYPSCCHGQWELV